MAVTPPVLALLLTLAVVERSALAQTLAAGGLLRPPEPAPARGGPALLPEVREGTTGERTPRPFSVYAPSWQLDGSLLAVTAAVWLTANRAGAGEPCATAACGRFMLGPVDRYAVGPRSPTADRASDITRGLALASPLVLEAISFARPNNDGGRAAALATDALVLAEAMMLTQGLTTLFKDSVGRRRPWSYTSDGDSQTRNDLRSFPSGHSSETFAAASVGCVTYVRRERPEALGAIAACAPGYALAAATAGLRVSAAAHFPSDVLIGAALGTAVGIAVPLLHGDPRRSKERMTFSLAPVTGGLGVGVSGRL